MVKLAYLYGQENKFRNRNQDLSKLMAKRLSEADMAPPMFHAKVISTHVNDDGTTKTELLNKSDVSIRGVLPPPLPNATPPLVKLARAACKAFKT